MSDRDKVIARIRAIRLKMSDEASSPEEAASYAEKVARMINDHQISEDELRPEEDPGSGVVHEIFNNGREIHEREHLLMSQIGALLSVQYVSHDEARNYFLLVGRKLNIEATIEMYNRIQEQIYDLANQLPWDTEGLLNGLTVGVAVQITKQKLTLMESKLPVVMELDAAKKYISDEIGATNQRTADSDRLMNSTESRLGAALSNQININDKVK